MSYIFLITLSLFFLIFFLWQYVFNIYEVEIVFEPKELCADGNSIVRIQTLPINSFGHRIPFRTVACEFLLIEGKELIEVFENYQTVGKFSIKVKGQIGKVSIRIKTNYSIIPTIVEINIKKNLT